MAEQAPVELPIEVLVHLLRYVPAKQRHGTCALVQTSWQQAALAATESVDLEIDKQDKLDSLQSWLLQHGQDLTALSLSCSIQGAEPLLQLLQPLPCPKLLCVELLGINSMQELLFQDITEGASYMTGCVSAPYEAAQYPLHGLTKLSIHSMAVSFTPEATPQLMQLTNLEDLEVSDVRMYGGLAPTLLAAFTSLRRLRLESTMLLKDDGNHLHNPTALLDVLPRLARLTELQLIGMELGYVSSAYTNLTSSSDLQLLIIKDAFGLQGAWRHVFPQDRVLPQLHTLALSMPFGGGPTGQLAEQLQLQPPNNAQHGTSVSLCDRDLQRIVSCCPNLVSLSLVNALSPQQLDPLLRLTGLTHLCVPSAGAPAGGVLLQLTQLSDLTLGQFGDLDLLQLTSMTQLTRFGRMTPRLDLSGWGMRNGCELALLNQAPPGAAPDVAEQLLQFCWHSSQCTPVLLRRQVDEQAQQLAQTQQQLSQKQQELSQTQQQLGQTQHELINTQQELAEARQQVVTLQQQVVSTSAAAGS